MKKQAFKVTVIIPVYNSASYLYSLFEQLSNQSLDDFEVVFVNDGSTDESLEIIKKQCEIDTNYRYINQDHKGAGVARNKGLSIAKGEYVIWIDADDYYSPELLKELYSSAIKHKADITMCLFEKKDLVKQTEETKIGFNRELFLDDCCVNPHDIDRLFLNCGYRITNKLFDKSFVEKNNLQFGETFASNDVFFNYASMACADKVVGIHKQLITVYRYTNNYSITSNKDNYTQCAISELNRLYDWLKINNLYNTYSSSYLPLMMNGIRFNSEFSYNHEFVNLAAETLCNKEPWTKLDDKQFQSYIKVLDTGSYYSIIEELQNSNDNDTNAIQNRIRKLNNMIFNIESIERITRNKYSKDLSISKKNNKNLELEKKIASLNDKISREKNSLNYRVGYVLTYIPKKIYYFIFKKGN